ncbi:uncharacterized protein LOC108917781 isoform X2 [Anoplophora glabripennis]|uniref:uncharacterized protein LOC108917781 isoform X2 n=1 Tax=Anoplophora glabripennis TaxID=217634 RepID=UPI000874BA93|nr:uncharacterized protein LOC108917781 isoform X2 [Anoplophora glabripennis]
MDLSTGQKMQEQFPFIKNRNESGILKPAASKNDVEFDIIDITKIKFDSDETWLFKVSDTCPITDLYGWLHNDDIKDEEYFLSTMKSQNESQKNFDSRTFTRPKKRFTRPSIEKYNEEVYGNSSDAQNESSDCSRKTNDNMSPPSLVNSMCSSTFANLMESSFIKNDPVLREIRDTDYTETVLLQDSEPPMFQSITESCSSINSDTPESFLKKMSFNGTFRKNTTKELGPSFDKSNNSTIDLNTTYEKQFEVAPENSDPVQVTNNEEIHKINNHQFSNLNGTYRRTPKSKGTFRKSDVKNTTLALNSTFDMPSDHPVSDHSTTTQALIKDCSLKSFEQNNSVIGSLTISNEDTVEDMKKQLSETVQITDLNRLSYCLDDNIRLDATYTEEDNLNGEINIKRTSLGCSTGSADSLDRMSSLSNSSRESNKMLNMADLDAIVEMQERSLQQVMSTPKTIQGSKNLWENNFISPIIPNEPLSDSDVSSTDEYKSVKSTFSKASMENYIGKPVKSMSYLGGNIDTKLKNTYRSTYTLSSQKPLQVIPNNIRASYSNLRTVQSNIPGSQGNLYKPSNVKAQAPSSNLKTMGHRLKGSYTSLRPISANLPMALPIVPQLNTTTTLSKATNPNVTRNIETRSKVAEVPPMPRGKVNVAGDNVFVKPQQPRASGLPRPTGIPRPASRIPGPRSNIRPISTRTGNVRRQTKDFP